MCIICVEYLKGTLNILEAQAALVEMSDEQIDEEHESEEVITLVEEKRLVEGYDD